jgi:thiosulfate dehydrogenase
MINWCIRNPLEGEAMNAADPRMIALQAYINYERRGVPMAPGKH